MKRCDAFYRDAMRKAKWDKKDMCDPPTEPRAGLRVLIDEMLGEDWHVAMPENDDQVMTRAIYEILEKYVDGTKRRVLIWRIVMAVSVILNVILLILR